MEPEDPNQWMLENHDFVSSLGVSIVEQETGYIRFALPYDEFLTNPNSDVMQGGAIATVIDHAASAAIRTALESPLDTPHATTDLNVSYVRPATVDLVVDASVIRSGNSIGFVNVDVLRESDEEIVATGRCTFRILRD